MLVCTIDSVNQPKKEKREIPTEKIFEKENDVDGQTKTKEQGFPNRPKPPDSEHIIPYQLRTGTVWP